MTNKMTNKKALEIAIAAMTAQETPNTEAIEKVQKILEQTIKKNSSERKPTATQTANVGLKEKILSYLKATGSEKTISELMKEIPELEGLSNQRVSALVRGLKEEGLITRVEVKRKAYFKACTTSEEEE
jgi:DNA-binding MarR family transcriptional regulator